MTAAETEFRADQNAAAAAVESMGGEEHTGLTWGDRRRANKKTARRRPLQSD
jgi:hypothetical protein